MFGWTRPLVPRFLFGFFLPIALAGSMAFSALAESEKPSSAPIVAQPKTTTSDWIRAFYRVRRLTPVRAEPRYDSPSLGFLAPGQQILITIKEQDQQWVSVESRDGLKGFVIESLVRPDDDASLIDLALWPLESDGTVTLEPVPPFEVRAIVPSNLTTEDKQQVQRALAYLGHYDGVVDGRFGERTFSAIRDFQRSNDTDPSGQLTFIQYYDLIGSANDRLEHYSMQTFSDANAGYRVDYPGNLLPSLVRVDSDTWRLSDRDDQVNLLITVGPKGADLQSAYEQLNVLGQFSYRLLKDRMFVLAGGGEGTGAYHVAKTSGEGFIQMSLTYPNTLSPIWEEFATVLFNSFDLTDN